MGYKKKASKEALDYDEDSPQYELVVVDADTAVFRASKFVQEDYVTVTHIPSGGVKEYPTKTEFYGHWKTKSGGWLADYNKKREEKGKKPIPVEDFEIESHVRLLPEIEDHIEEGLKNFDMFIGGLKKQKLAEEYLLLIGGDGNYRYDAAQIQKYKGDRLEKPILFLEIRDAILDKYGRHIEVVDGKEVDDEMAVYGEANQSYFEEIGVYKYILAYIDKDIDMVMSPSINYDKYDEGIRVPTKLDCMRCLCAQLLIGDPSVDNIPALPNLEPELREEFGVRKGKSLGKATALSYLESATTEKELLTRVVRAYVAHYGKEPFEFESFRGDKLEWTWLDMLQERAILIYMNPYDVPEDFHITWLLDEYEVDIEGVLSDEG